jgi:hypothetical protein
MTDFLSAAIAAVPLTVVCRFVAQVWSEWRADGPTR